MPPFDLWLTGRDDIFTWWFGPGNGCRGSRVIPVESANGAPAFGQYKPRESGDGYEPWALQVLEIEDGGSSSSRSSSTSRPSSRASGFRSSSRCRGEACLALEEHVREPHELDELEERLRCALQPDGAAESHRSELETGQRVDRHRVRRDAGHVTDDAVRTLGTGDLVRPDLGIAR